MLKVIQLCCCEALRKIGKEKIDQKPLKKAVGRNKARISKRKEWRGIEFKWLFIHRQLIHFTYTANISEAGPFGKLIFESNMYIWEEGELQEIEEAVH
jgi:hypothetical protein